ncbi:MAG: ATP-binding protein [Bacillota bacterium]|nr:ATP-binding protein [Bacillota bacterium]
MRSLAGRAALVYTLLIVVFLGGAGWYLTAAAERFALQSLRDQLSGQAGAVAMAVLPYLRNQPGAADQAHSGSARELAALRSLVAELASTIAARVTIVDLAGTVLGDSHHDPETMENHADRPEIRSAVAHGWGSAIRQSSTLGERMLYVAVPIGDPARPVGVARVAWPLARVDRWLGDLRRTFLLGTLVSVVLAVIASVAVSRWLGRPLVELGARARAMAGGDMTARLYLREPHEVAEIGTALNELASRLQGTISELELQRHELAALLEQMADGVVVVDRSGLPVRSNAAARRLLGSGLATPGVRVTEVVPRPEVRDALERCLAGERQEVILQHGDLLLRLVLTPVEQGALILVQDLTPVRRLETMRRDFVANLSHEIRTPLAVIKALAETLERTGSPEEARPFLVQITGQVDRLTRLTRRLMELARLESGSPELHLEECHLGEIARSTVDSLAPMARPKGIAVEVDVPPDLPAVRGDRDLLRELLGNLLDNALKFTPAGGRVSVSACSRDGEILVQVKDTGRGIPATELPRIFERFYKGRTPGGAGTGLGLAICKHIVLVHGGEIWAESEPGEGSTFSFTLPRRGPSPPP